MGRHSTLDYGQKQTRTWQDKPLFFRRHHTAYIGTHCLSAGFQNIQPAKFQNSTAVWLTNSNLHTRRGGIFTTFIYPRESSIHRFDAPFPTMHPVFLHFRRKTNGLVLSIVDSGGLRPECAADIWHRKAGEVVMTFFYIVGAIAALLLMVYLVIALLKPELFS